MEANIPRSKLTIDAEDGDVVIVGTVPSQKEYDTILPLAQDITGEDADAVVLETDGSFSVITNINNSSASALKDVKGFDRTMMACIK